MRRDERIKRYYCVKSYLLDALCPVLGIQSPTESVIQEEKSYGDNFEELHPSKLCEIQSKCCRVSQERRGEGVSGDSSESFLSDVNWKSSLHSSTISSSSTHGQSASWRTKLSLAANNRLGLLLFTIIRTLSLT